MPRLDEATEKHTTEAGADQVGMQTTGQHDGRRLFLQPESQFISGLWAATQDCSPKTIKKQKQNIKSSPQMIHRHAESFGFP